MNNLQVGTTSLRIDLGAPVIRNYFVDVIRAASADANLAALEVSPGRLEPAFSSMTTVYSVRVTDSVASVVLAPVANAAGATIAVDGVSLPGASYEQNVVRGAVTSVTFVVTAPDGVTTKGYTVGIVRDDLTLGLTALSVTPGTLVPAFSSRTLAYRVEVPYQVRQVTVAGSPRGSATVSGIGISGGTSYTTPFSRMTDELTPGETTRTMVVVTRTVDGVSYSRTYTVEVVRALAMSTVQVGVFLQGAYAGAGNMSTRLSEHLPASQPYGVAPWEAPMRTIAGMGAGDFGLSGVTATVVDWVLVELRKTARGAGPAAAATSLAREAALLLRDGTVVGVDGTSTAPLRTEGVFFGAGVDDASEDLYVLVHHRNHLSVMATATAVGCGTGADYCVDFRNRQSHRNRQASVGGGRYAMFAGDTDSDNDIDVADETVIRSGNLRIISAGDYQGFNDGSYAIDADVDFDGEVLSGDRRYIILNVAPGTAAPACPICAP